MYVESHINFGWIQIYKTAFFAKSPLSLNVLLKTETVSSLDY